MRLVGVRTKDLMLGSAAVMVPVLLASYAISAALGVLVGIRMSSFTKQITELTQQAVAPGVLWRTPVTGSFVAALLMFGAAWLSGLRHFVKIAPIDAVTGRDESVPRAGGARSPLLAGMAFVVLGWGIVLIAPEEIRMAALLPLLGGAALVSIVLPVAIGGLLRSGEPRAVRMLAGRQLQVAWRRNATLSVAFAVAIMMALCMAGVAGSIKETVGASVERWTPAQLYVQAARVGHNLQNEMFPASFEEELRSVDGVDATCSYSYSNVGIGDRRVQMWSWGATRPCETLTDLRVSRGSRDFLTRLGRDEIAISSNFARTRHMSVGSTVRMPLPTGHRTVTVKAVVDDSASDGGMIIAGSRLYHEVTASSGSYAFYVALRPGADAAKVKRSIENLFGTHHPRAVVLTQHQLRTIFASIVARLVSAFEAVAWVMFVLAVLVGATTLASGLRERQHALALTRLTRATAKLVGRQIVLESLLVAFAAWAVAMPVGLLSIRPMLDAQALQSGVLPPVTVPMWLTALSLPLVALCILLALLIANPKRANTPLRALLAQE
ncbi:ABC transporter permease [Streptomyces violaceusniger]|uniref:ABC transporter permease n=1 Tax=Streptomyces violaceusniger TaxID=68280 RepID=UPI0010F70644